MTEQTTSQVRRNSMLGMTLHTEIIIEASPKQVWDVLTDFASYGEWNQSIPYAQGVASTGTLLRVTIHWPGLRSSPYVLEVLAAAPDRELRWMGRFGRTGLMDGDHRFVIEPIGVSRCKVTQTEYFYGWLVPFFAPWLRRNVLSGFEQMNAALKNRAETGISAEFGGIS
jgi:hypothetical protein